MKTAIKPLVSIVLTIFLFTIYGVSLAATTSYTDRSAWNSANDGSSDFFVDFNEYTEDTLIGTGLDVGAFSIFVDEDRGIDVPEYHNSDGDYGNGTPNLSLFVDGRDKTATFSFTDSPILSFFSDFWVAGNFSNATFSLRDYDNNEIALLSIPGTGKEPSSFGFISDISVYSIILGNRVNDGLQMDNIEGYYADSSPVSAVPIPAAAIMFAPALFGLLGFRRKLRA